MTNKKTGARFNTDWLDEDANRKEQQIDFSNKEAQKLNNDSEDNSKQEKLLDDQFGDSLGKRSEVTVMDGQRKVLLNALQENKLINPHFDDENQDRNYNYKNNCAICTVATMMQSMGYNVEAGIQIEHSWVEASTTFVPDLTNPKDFIVCGSRSYHFLQERNIKHNIRNSLDAKGITDESTRTSVQEAVVSKLNVMPKGAAKASNMINDVVSKWPNGAFGEMSVTWKNNDNHSLFIFNDNGIVKVYDMQAGWVRSGQNGLQEILKETRANNTEVVRYDNFVGFRPKAKERLLKVLKERK